MASQPEQLVRADGGEPPRGASGAIPPLRRARPGAWLLATVRETPGVLPALGALALFVGWATDEGGYPLTMWAPGGLIVLGLLAVALLASGGRPLRRSRATMVALGALAAYTAWSFLSIAWANAPGDAWEGADRTLLYLLVFALFASAGVRGRGAALLVGAWALALAGVAAFVVIHLGTLGGDALHDAFPDGRLTFPVGYVNAQAAQWMIAAWAAFLLARSAHLHPLLRGALAGAAVLLADVALFSLSRGALLASAIVLVLVLALIPGRVRTFVVLVPIALGVGLSAPTILAVGSHLGGGSAAQFSLPAAQSALASASAALFAAAAAVALAVALAAAADRAGAFAGVPRARVRRGLATLEAAALVALVVGGLVAAGSPIARVRHEWDTFKSPQGYAANGTNTNRLFGGLGSSRYDFYRVALGQFEAHPVAGIGADNFFAEYLRRGHSSETPRYPHSVELRTLTETGVVGALLALAGLAGALVASGRALRRGGQLERAVAAAALGGFGYWVIHGSADWFFEYAGLGAPAFALLGIACALDPGRKPQAERRGPAHTHASGPHGSRASRMALPRALVHTPSLALPAGAARWRSFALGGLAIAAAVAAGLSLAAPWLSAVDVRSAARIWVSAPASAFARLRDAAQLDPLSAEPDVVAGTIALRLGDLPSADRYFAGALARSPEDQYATLERGAIASQRGEAARALELLTRAVALYPRDELAKSALRRARAGGRVSVASINRAILQGAQELH